MDGAGVDEKYCNSGLIGTLEKSNYHDISNITREQYKKLLGKKKQDFVKYIFFGIFRVCIICSLQNVNSTYTSFSAAKATAAKAMT